LRKGIILSVWKPRIKICINVRDHKDPIYENCIVKITSGGTKISKPYKAESATVFTSSNDINPTMPTALDNDIIKNETAIGTKAEICNEIIPSEITLEAQPPRFIVINAAPKPRIEKYLIDPTILAL
jgi:hypothetical protein